MESFVSIAVKYHLCKHILKSLLVQFCCSVSDGTNGQKFLSFQTFFELVLNEPVGKFFHVIGICPEQWIRKYHGSYMGSLILTCVVQWITSNVSSAAKKHLEDS